VAGGADRQVFSDALDQSEDKRLDQVHFSTARPCRE
jgi:hypothetical protein